MTAEELREFSAGLPDDPNAWDRDAMTLPHGLEYDEGPCERTFMSKHEAFNVGLRLGAERQDVASQGGSA
jgi:hypothetical protein